MATVKTYWNGEECKAVRCWVIVANHGTFPTYWAKHLEGRKIQAVEVTCNGEVSYLYDENGRGWYKVTEGFGSPHVAHKNLEIERVVRYNDYDI